MKTNLSTEFSMDKESNAVNVNRKFNASICEVWSAWSEPDILDKWWAPKPFVSRTKSMEFKEGGQRLYAMLGPRGEEQWCLVNYKSIIPRTYFKYRDASVMIKETSTRLNFQGRIGALILSEMGFKEGFTIAMEGLDELFPKREIIPQFKQSTLPEMDGSLATRKRGGSIFCSMLPSFF